MWIRVGRVFRRLLFFARRSTLERELAEEIELHRSFLENALIREGADAGEAGWASSRQMGNTTLARENSRDLWCFPRAEAIFQDVRHSVRGLVRSPVFAFTAIFSLALGIGANTAIFTAADTLLFKPLPVKDPGSLVTFSVTDHKGAVIDFLPLAFGDQLRLSGAFTDVIAANSDGLSFTDGGRAERVIGEVVTPNFFSALGVAPVVGRTLSSQVVAGKWAAEAVLSYSFWKSRFGGDARVIGRVIRLNTHPFTIVGVSPSSFLDLHQGQNPEVRIPVLPAGLEIKEIANLGAGQEFELLARLAPGVSRVQAVSVANSQVREFVRTTSDERVRGRGYGRVSLVSGARGWPDLVEEYQGSIAVLLLLSVAGLMIACANVASMLLARAAVRRREFALRSSLGAGRGRLISQILAEGFVLSFAGGLAGLLIARAVAQLLLHFLPQGHIRVTLDLDPGAASTMFALLLSIVSALLLGLPAALQSTRGDLAQTLKTDSNSSVGGSRGLRKVLVAFQLAFSLALLVVAGLFVRTVLNLRPGAEYTNARSTLVITLKPQQEIYTPERIRSVVAEVIRRVSSIRGVQAVGIAEHGPFASLTKHDVVQSPGRPAVEVVSDVVSSGFLNAIGLAVLYGRDFAPSDKPGSPKVVILSEGLARMLFPNGHAVGEKVQLLSARGTVLYPQEGAQYFRVIGIVPDTHYYNLRRLRPIAFFAFQSDPPYMPTLHARVASANPEPILPAILREFDAVDSGFPLFNIRTLEGRLEDALARERMIADLASAFGGLALVLAAIGLYGVLAYSVAQRTREIGVRIALGSTTGAILWLVGSEAVKLVAIGAGAGLVISAIAGGLVANRLYGVAPVDFATLSVATGGLLVVAVFATLSPALKASRIDPVCALRHD